MRQFARHRREERVGAIVVGPRAAPHGDSVGAEPHLDRLARELGQRTARRDADAKEQRAHAARRLEHVYWKERHEFTVATGVDNADARVRIAAHRREFGRHRRRRHAGARVAHAVVTHHRQQVVRE